MGLLNTQSYSTSKVKIFALLTLMWVVPSDCFSQELAAKNQTQPDTNNSAHLNSELADRLEVGFHRSVPIALDMQNAEFSGFYGKIYQCLFDKLDGTFSYQSLPVRRMTKMLESGKLDIGVLLARTNLRDNHSTFVGPFIKHPYLLLTNKDTSIAEITCLKPTLKPE